MKTKIQFRRFLALFLLVSVSIPLWADKVYIIDDDNVLLMHDHIQYKLNIQTKEATVGNGIDDEKNAIDPPKYGDPDYGTNYWRDLIIPSEVTYNSEIYTVKSIAWRAFGRTTYVHNIILPETITNISSEAFYMCTELESVTIPDGVTSIGSGAFMLCRSLKYVHLPSSLTEIKEKTFSDCYTLEEINIPGACTTVGIDAFTACKQLSKLRIDDGIGLLTFTYSEAVPVNYQAITEDKDDLLPHIRGQFADCPIDSLYLGRDVSFPREYYSRWKKVKTFFPFERISEYRLYLDKPRRYLFESADFSCVEFGDNVTNIPDSLFCSIENDSYYLGGGGIHNAISLPANLETIGIDAFCGSLIGTETLIIPESVKTISSGAFSKGKISKLILPNSFLNIRSTAFENNRIRELNIPDNVTYIGVGAFANNSIYKLTLPNKNIPIGWDAFANNQIEELVIPEMLTQIDGFYGNNIRELTIPSSVTQIGTRAFLNNPLRNVNCNTETPPSESNPFSDATIYVPSGTGSTYRQQWSDALIVDDSDDIISINVKTAGTLYSRLLAQDYQTGDVCKLKLKGTLNDGDLAVINDMSRLYYLDLSEMQVEEVADGLFHNTPRLVTAKLPNTLTSIHDDEFRGCNNLTGDIQIPASCTFIGKKAFANTAIKTLTSSEPITIDKSAFENCYLLQDFDIIPGTAIGDSAFYRCYKLQKEEIPSGTHVGKAAFQATRSIEKITISSGVSIGDNAFSDSDLSEVIIENGVNEIAERAFGLKVKKITFNGSVASIGNIFFDGLEEVHVPDVATWCQLPITDEGPMKFSPHLYIGEEEATDVVVPNSVSNLRDYAFLNCNTLTSVTLSPGVKSIGNEAFNNCGNLTSVVLPVTLTEIGEKAFQNCGELVAAQLPSKLASIGEYTFSGCAKLASLSLPATLTSIQQNAFSGCSSLIKLDLPSSITSIEQHAFENCSALQTVAVHWDDPITIGDVFTLIPSDCYLYCPINTATKYFNAGWNVFTNLKEAGILSITANIGGVVSCYDEDITNRSEDIYFKPYKSFNITVSPETGYNIMKIRLNGEDISSELDDGVLFIEEPEENMTLSVTFADNNIVLCDVNGDGAINSLDVISVAHNTLKQTPDQFYEYAADVNDDGVINITDAIIIVQQITNSNSIKENK